MWGLGVAVTEGLVFSGSATPTFQGADPQRSIFGGSPPFMPTPLNAERPRVRQSNIICGEGRVSWGRPRGPAFYANAKTRRYH